MIIENGHQKLRCSNHGGGLNIVIELASYLWTVIFLRSL
jgi:hypothetical protein